MPATSINIHVDSEVKSQAQEIFTSLGLDMDTAIDIFLRQAIRQHGIPFAVTTELVKKKPKPGCMKGKIWMTEDFDSPLEDFREYME